MSAELLVLLRDLLQNVAGAATVTEVNIAAGIALEHVERLLKAAGPS